MDFKAEKDSNGKFLVKAIREEKPNGDVIMHVPSIPIMQKLIKDEQLREKEVKDKKQ